MVSRGILHFKIQDPAATSRSGRVKFPQERNEWQYRVIVPDLLELGESPDRKLMYHNLDFREIF
jgi:hypothetical protein